MNLIPSHRFGSKTVKSYEEIERDALELRYLSNGKFNGYYEQCFALHHSQVSRQPYNFFTVSKQVEGRFTSWLILNPKIISKDRDTKYKVKEGCMSFPLRTPTNVFRYKNVRISYQIYEQGVFGVPLLKQIEENVEGLVAEIFQHEIDHANGKNIYD